MSLHLGEHALRRRAAPVALVVCLALSPACRKEDLAPHGCRRDDDCGASSLACVAEVCADKIDGYPGVAAELTPPSDSRFAATEMGAVTLSWETTLTASPKVNVTATVQDSEGDVFSAQGHVLLSRPSLIPGRAALAAAGELAGGSVAFSLPMNAVGVNASLTLLPTATPAVQPPLVRTVTLAPQIVLTLPKRADLSAFSGTLLSALGDPVAAYLVRGLPDGASTTSTAITSVATTGQDGGFTLLTDPATKASAGTSAMRLEFWDPGEGPPSPRLYSDPLTASNGAGPYGKSQWRLPAYVAPTRLRFRVVGGESLSTPIKDATMRFRTMLASAGSGQAIFSQEGKSDDNGQVDVSLVPGTLDEARLYDVAVVPPPDSPFDGKCLTGFPVAAPASSNSTDVPVASVLHLSRKWQLGGHVRDASGLPVASATITATRLSTDTDHGCLTGLIPDATSANTDATGSYFLLLESGTYRIEVDPPAGSPWPRLAASASGGPVAVASDTSLELALPSAVVARGHAQGPNGEPVTNADLRFFRLACPSSVCGGSGSGAPELLAASRTDADGVFRVVVPAP